MPLKENYEPWFFYFRMICTYPVTRTEPTVILPQLMPKTRELSSCSFLFLNLQ